MSKGLGRTQRECMHSIERHPEGATTFTIAADVYNVKLDRDGNRMISDAQHVATARALRGLQRIGLIVGRQDMRFRQRLRDGSYDPNPSARAERCCIWVKAAALHPHPATKSR